MDGHFKGRQSQKNIFIKEKQSYLQEPAEAKLSLFAVSYQIRSNVLNLKDMAGSLPTFPSSPHLIVLWLVWGNGSKVQVDLN